MFEAVILVLLGSIFGTGIAYLFLTEYQVEIPRSKIKYIFLIMLMLSSAFMFFN